MVMDAGRIVESGEPSAVFAAPQAQATLAMVQAVPQLTTAMRASPGTCITPATNAVEMTLRWRTCQFALQLCN